MQSLNNTTDVQKFLQSGPLTNYRVHDLKLTKRVGGSKTDREKIDVLLKYLHNHNRDAKTKRFIGENIFDRNVNEIMESGKMTGCTDWAMSFAAIARQHGIPTSFFTTAEKEWAEEVCKGENKANSLRGHSFCECFIDGKWVLVDPTKSVVQDEYDADNLHLTGEKHFVGGKKDFIPYYRGLDIDECFKGREKEGKLKPEIFLEYAQDMIIKNNQENKAVIEPVTKEELTGAGFTGKETKIHIEKYLKQTKSKDVGLNRE